MKNHLSLSLSLSLLSLLAALALMPGCQPQSNPDQELPSPSTPAPSAQASPAPTPDAPADPVPIRPTTRLQLVVRGSSSVPLGQPATFNITLTNLGPKPAQDVTIVYTLQPGVTVISSPDAQVQDNKIIWSFPTINIGAAAKTSFSLQASAIGPVSGMAQAQARNASPVIASASVEIRDPGAAPVQP